jgi:hypothetical protein
MRKLEVQLKDKHETVSKLESRVGGLEKILKKPMKEAAKEEPMKEEPVKELAKEEPEIKIDPMTLAR